MEMSMQWELLVQRLLSSDRRNLDSLSLFYSYYLWRCSSDLDKLVHYGSLLVILAGRMVFFVAIR